MCGGSVLDEVLLVGAGGVDGRGLGDLLGGAGAAEGSVAASEEHGEDTDGELGGIGTSAMSAPGRERPAPDGGGGGRAAAGRGQLTQCEPTFWPAMVYI